MDYIYLIIPTSEMSIHKLNHTSSRRLDQLRYNEDASKCVVKVLKPAEECLAAYLQYSLAEIIIELQKAEWVITEEEETSFLSKLATFFGIS